MDLFYFDKEWSVPLCKFFEGSPTDKDLSRSLLVQVTKEGEVRAVNNDEVDSDEEEDGDYIEEDLEVNEEKEKVLEVREGFVEHIYKDVEGYKETNLKTSKRAEQLFELATRFEKDLNPNLLEKQRRAHKELSKMGVSLEGRKVRIYSKETRHKTTLKEVKTGILVADAKWLEKEHFKS